ncbi:MAG: hypothetical protein WKG07_01670 [Hymenobacter sp.]
MELNAGGLQSNGTVTYLMAKLESDRFVMYNDSLTGEGKAGSIAASAHLAQGEPTPGYLINWGARTDLAAPAHAARAGPWPSSMPTTRLRVRCW